MPIPSLWGEEWPLLQTQIRQADPLVLFLDYDGTLTRITVHPSKARLSGPLRERLRQLSRLPGVWVTLVSGRGLQDLKQKVGVEGIYYVGNHGLELQGPGLRHLHPAARKSRPVLSRIRDLLRKELKPLPGAWVEDKGLTLSVHYRQAKPEDRPLVETLFHQIVAPFLFKRQIRVTAGKRVCEVRPPVHWTKGTMVAWLLARQSVLSKGRKILPIYAGDDRTDEDAFKALRGRGITIAVGRSNPLTLAKYRVRSADEIGRLLGEILRIRLGSAG